jgi:hypothetical protein
MFSVDVSSWDKPLPEGIVKFFCMFLLYIEFGRKINSYDS